MSGKSGTSAGPVIFILAAGEGTRMHSQLPKVLHKVLGRTLIEHVIDAANELNPSQLVVVVGAHRELVEEVVSKVSPGAKIVVQEKRGGTGHAVRIALENVKVSAESPILVLAGDIPLITSSTLQSLLDTHLAEQNSATVLTAQIDDPEGYGRIVRDGSDGILRIVEDRDATEIEREITEINSSVYVFNSHDLVDSLSKINNKNAQGEEYLTDAIGVLQSTGKRVEPVIVEDFIEIIAFSKYNQIDSRVKSTIRQIVDDCPKSFRDYILINYKFLTRNFEEVIIKNDNGEIIGSENISRLVDKYKNGVVILQKGSEPYYIDLVPQNPRVGDKWESVDLYCTIAAKLRCDCWD